MEILLNEKFFKVHKKTSEFKFEFENLSTSDKQEFEKWFHEVHSSEKVIRRAEFKKNLYLIDDSNIYELQGVLPKSIGDSSHEFSFVYDSKELLKFDLIAFLISRNKPLQKPIL